MAWAWPWACATHPQAGKPAGKGRRNIHLLIFTARFRGPAYREGMQTSLLRGLPANPLVKRIPLLVVGMVVPLVIAAIVPRAVGGGVASTPPRSHPHPPPSASMPVPTPADVPRGDLRSDIVRNAQSRPDLASPPAAPRPRNVRDQR